ncbi:MAG: D-arabinose 5-phosphate isomerase [Flavobacteriales bacterium]|nr:D-arabinose 5-phosphate isomerase [Flavobacteriales bacterium]|tara:strand:- start:20452 stop:21417 length:966 start_codon:yes stop_codon:yes gene_type:complete
MKNKIEILQIGKNLIREQADALKILSERIDDNFINVVELIAQCSGRLIILGLGKSGIIGRKISGTLNSTGTVSSFIHASDAIHGDVGNINNFDIVMCISKSGNTDELKMIIPTLKKMKIKIIAMTGSVNSYLAKNSDYLLDVSIEKEACPNNLAPTTSTTMQLVMGDALSMSLLKLKNFSKKDFAKLHPGGVLGRKLSLRVSDLYKQLPTPHVTLEDNISQVIMEISSKRVGSSVVKDNKKIVGIITDGDLRRMLENNDSFNNIRAKDCMTHNPKIIDEDMLLFEAFNIMKVNNISQLIVTKQNQYIGIIHLHDILKHNFF